MLIEVRTSSLQFIEVRTSKWIKILRKHLIVMISFFTLQKHADKRGSSAVFSQVDVSKLYTRRDA